MNLAMSRRAVLIICVLLMIGGAPANAQPQFNLQRNTVLVDQAIPIVVSG
jgi:hypothetical protein